MSVSVWVCAAFEKLVDSHMLSAGEQRALLASLRFRPSDVWLKAMYRARLHKYDLSMTHPLSLPGSPPSPALAPLARVGAVAWRARVLQVLVPPRQCACSSARQCASTPFSTAHFAKAHAHEEEESAA